MIKETDIRGTHEAAELFPVMEEPELQELTDDIAKNGLLVPILVFDSMVLDGRNRLLACTRAGVEPEFIEYNGTDPVSVVISQNIHRRHLKPGQKRELIKALVALEPQRSSLQIAKETGVSDKTVEKIRSETSVPSGDARSLRTSPRTDIKGRKYGRATELSEEEQEELAELRVAGKTREQIAEHFDVSVPTVRKYWSHLPPAEMKRLVEEQAGFGLDRYQIAAALGVSDWTVRKYMPEGTPEPEDENVVGTLPLNKTPRNVPLETRLEQIREWAEKDYSSKEIADKIGLGADNVRRYAKQAGITIPADSFVLRKSQKRESNEIMGRLVVQVETLGEGLLDGIDFSTLAVADIPEWIEALNRGRKGITQLINKLKGLLEP